VSTETVLTLDWPAIAGSGFVAAVIIGALTERLRRVFASRQELNGLGDKFNALQSLYLQVRESADEARERAKANQAAQKQQWERIAEQVIKPLERITDRLEAVGEAQAAQATALEFIGKRLDQSEAQRSTSYTHTSRKKP
jgi:acyl-CoA reductase-like NAD-dependent aldehyde dehydrogenase